MRIGHDGSDAARHHRGRELPHADHRAFDVHVRIDQARRQIAPFKIDFLVRRVARPDANDPIIQHGDIRWVDLTGVNIYEVGIAQHQIRRHVAARCPHQGVFLCHYAILLVEPML